MADIYVTSGGNDSSGDGSSAYPYLTISKAWTESSNGDVIIINDSSTFTVVEGGANQITTVGGALKTNLTFKAGAGFSPIFDGGGNATYCMKAWAGWTVQGLTFRNFGTSNTHNVVHQYDGFNQAVTIEDCTFYAITGSAASFGGAGTIYRRNKIYDCTKFGLNANLAGGESYVENNLIYDCGSLAISAVYTTVRFNTVYNAPRRDNPDSTRTYSIRGLGVYYNIVYESNPSIAAISAFRDHAYNCITGSSPLANTYSTSASVGDLNADPVFKNVLGAGGNPANHDFTLDVTSPCLKHGTHRWSSTPPSPVTVDILSGSRVWDYDHKVMGTGTGGVFDIGCYEEVETKVLGVVTKNINKVLGKSG
tara:strand:- start:217 stop:1311 length:1095 start_codon:yes stop_codon:yes gene_type:complete